MDIQISNPDKWASLVPEYLKFINPVILIYLNGAFETILGVLFLLGFFTRITALLFSLHLIPIMFSLGYGPAAVRDFGLCLSSLSLVFSGSGNWTLVNFIKRK